MNTILTCLSILILGLGIGFYSGVTYVNANLSGDLENLHSTVKTLEDSLNLRDVRIKERDEAIASLECKIDTLNQVSIANQQRLQKLKKDLNNELNKVKTYSTADISNYLNERYSPK